MRIAIGIVFAVVIAAVWQLFFSPLSVAREYSSAAKSDRTYEDVLPEPGTHSDVKLLSAFFGLDDSPRINWAGFRLCTKLTGGDGMPVVFSHELDIATIEAADLRVVKRSGQIGRVDCVTLAPAVEPGELRTLLLMGDFGSADNDPPVKVEVVGNLGSFDNTINFRGTSVAVTPLALGPSLVFAEVVPPEAWQLDESGSAAPVDCPKEGLEQIIRVVWDGGVKPPTGLSSDLAKLYEVTMSLPDGSTRIVQPFALGNTGDVDNNIELCMDISANPVSVSFPGGYLVDPNGDLNADTSIGLLH